MQKSRWIVAGTLALGLGILVLLTGQACAQAAVPAPAAPRAAEAKPGEYWLGVEAQYPLPDAVRAQLSIPKDEGVLVQEVVPSTPAQGKLQNLNRAGDIQPMEEAIRRLHDPHREGDLLRPGPLRSGREDTAR